MRCVVFGATGYIGGRLIPELLAEGHEVTVLARRPQRLAEVPWRQAVRVVEGDATDPASVHAAVEGQQVVYYLVHSLAQADFEELDRTAARNLADAASQAGVQRVVYLGGILPEQQQLSAHLRSRAEVGQILLDGGAPTVVLQAAVIIGSGSASFEMLRYLTERLPAMVTPRWVRNRVQPIAVRDVLHYLRRAVDLPSTVHRSFDIAGPDVLTYKQMMEGYAAVARLPQRVIVPVRVLTPWLSAQWVHLVTPVPSSIAVPLVESLIHEVVRREWDLDAYIDPPPGGATRYEDALSLALMRIRNADVPTRWSDASWPAAPSDPLPIDPDWSGGSVYTDERVRASSASTQAQWDVIESIGGEHGWYSFPLAWSVRGWLDRLAGGVGLRRGRRDPRRLHAGEALDWWRVERIERPRLLRLQAEMKLPGRAWLELAVEPRENGGSTYWQRAVFAPHGLLGHLYWKAMVPFHAPVFGGMARNITRTAARHERQRHRGTPVLVGQSRDARPGGTPAGRVRAALSRARAGARARLQARGGERRAPGR